MKTRTSRAILARRENLELLMEMLPTAESMTCHLMILMYH
jgi:hypothetical protein